MSCTRTIRSARGGAKRRAGFSLMEITVCAPLIVLLIAGSASAIYLAARAIPNGDTPTTAVLQGTAALDQLASELPLATAITTRSANQVTFVLPDRTADNVAESICYSWSGVSGAPLTRQINGSPAETLISKVQAWTLAYTTQTNASGLPELTFVEVRLTLTVSPGTRLDRAIKIYNRPVLP